MKNKIKNKKTKKKKLLKNKKKSLNRFGGSHIPLTNLSDELIREISKNTQSESLNRIKNLVKKSQTCKRLKNLLSNNLSNAKNDNIYYLFNCTNNHEKGVKLFLKDLINLNNLNETPDSLYERWIKPLDRETILNQIADNEEFNEQNITNQIDDSIRIKFNDNGELMSLNLTELNLEEINEIPKSISDIVVNGDIQIEAKLFNDYFIHTCAEKLIIAGNINNNDELKEKLENNIFPNIISIQWLSNGIIWYKENNEIYYIQ